MSPNLILPSPDVHCDTSSNIVSDNFTKFESLQCKILSGCVDLKVQHPSLDFLTSSFRPPRTIAITYPPTLWYLMISVIRTVKVTMIISKSRWGNSSRCPAESSWKVFESFSIYFFYLILKFSITEQIFEMHVALKCFSYFVKCFLFHFFLFTGKFDSSSGYNAITNFFWTQIWKIKKFFFFLLKRWSLFACCLSKWVSCFNN